MKRRTPIVILGSGLLGCIALTMCMGHLLSLQTKPDKTPKGPVVAQFGRRFASKLERPPSLMLRPVKRKREIVGITVVAEVRPKKGIDKTDLAVEMGHYLWKSEFEMGAVKGVHIHLMDAETGRTAKVKVAHPDRGRRRLRRGSPKPPSSK